MSEQNRKVVPAQLGFLAIYNPSLGSTDDTLDNQIVYYYPSIKQNEHKRSVFTDTKEARAFAKEQKNEQLRQIGLAQGMVEFGRSFSEGKSVNTIETEKSRIILHELESGWWILASINLTILPSTAKTPVNNGKSAEEQGTVEYSSREVKPAILLLADVLRAHSTFLLHHAASMSALFVRTKRSKFVSILGRYWDTYLSTWNVLMHGNPANNLYGGIKLAACGELGVGVGEEERGSGEREALEGFVGQMDGLVDVMVSRFGDARSNSKEDTSKGFTDRPKQPAAWLGSGNEPAAEDGAIFLGTGALSRKSVKDISHWVEDLYRWGPYTYGVLDNPSSTRRAKRQPKPRPRLDSKLGDTKNAGRPTSSLSKEIPIHDGLNDGPNDGPVPSRSSSISTVEPRPVVEQDDQIDQPKLKSIPPYPKVRRNPASHTSTEGTESTDGESKGKKFTQYLKFGYGTHWSLGGSSAKEEERSRPSSNTSTLVSSIDGIVNTTGTSTPTQESDDSKGHYLVGLMGDMDSETTLLVDSNDEDEDLESQSHRLVLRTLTVELEREEDARQEADISIDYSNFGTSFKNASGSEGTGHSHGSFESQDRNKVKKLRVVAYASKPFIFIFLFELRADTLALKGLYRSLHKQLQSLIKPLLKSTSFRAPKPEVPISPLANTKNPTAPIYDLLWDPKFLTLDSNIPNIPDPQQVQTQEQADSLPWSRIEALNTHLQIRLLDSLDSHSCTSPAPPESITNPTSKVKIPPLIPENSAESQTSKTFMGELSDKGRKNKDMDASIKANSKAQTQSTVVSGPAHPFLDDGAAEEGAEERNMDKEIFLIRRASDYVEAGQGRGYGYGYAGWGMGGQGAGTGSTADAGWGAAGLGLDTKRYIEGLLSLNR
ncbi:putative vacuolar fusion protein ccz1 protein [Botrytis fragariae]|uniref:Putative vacuolar fusion protein ccz1 protein n=1 Tax=Botrytis fragariae TaxID=1964551 RepID=A0A8H6ALG3_9HELO|nr:putative vacuolar fusion protein ccz1 protein [Botrytis fragariae]KAF5869604.1 putative vacuolar fusion protein ccz1 protein [Botrytis fragariae]